MWCNLISTLGCILTIASSGIKARHAFLTKGMSTGRILGAFNPAYEEVLTPLHFALLTTNVDDMLIASLHKVLTGVHVGFATYDAEF